jgi:hypothetical protein
MEPSAELISDLHRERLKAAARMSPEQKFIAGAELFDYACRLSMAGIRSQYPDASDAEVLNILKERLAWAERRERAE